MSDRDFAIRVRRLLLSVISEIEKRYKLGAYSEGTIQAIDERDSMTI